MSCTLPPSHFHFTSHGPTQRLTSTPNLNVQHPTSGTQRPKPCNPHAVRVAPPEPHNPYLGRGERAADRNRSLKPGRDGVLPVPRELRGLVGPPTFTSPPKPGLAAHVRRRLRSLRPRGPLDAHVHLSLLCAEEGRRKSPSGVGGNRLPAQAALCLCSRGGNSLLGLRKFPCGSLKVPTILRLLERCA